MRQWAALLRAPALLIAGASVVWWKFGRGGLLEFLTFVGLTLGILILLLMVGHRMSTPKE